MYAKVLSISDELMWRYYALLTDLSRRRRSRRRSARGRPMESKMALARRLVGAVPRRGRRGGRGGRVAARAPAARDADARWRCGALRRRPLQAARAAGRGRPGRLEERGRTAAAPARRQARRRGARAGGGGRPAGGDVGGPVGRHQPVRARGRRPDEPGRTRVKPSAEGGGPTRRGLTSRGKGRISLPFYGSRSEGAGHASRTHPEDAGRSRRVGQKLEWP